MYVVLELGAMPIYLELVWRLDYREIEYKMCEQVQN